MKKVCIVASKRIPFVKSHTHYMGLSNQELIVPVLNALVDELNISEVGEVVLGAVNKHSYDFALARECVMESKLSPMTPATDIQKACGTSLESTIIIANKIAIGQIDCGIAAGSDTNSDIAVELPKSFSDTMLKVNASRTMPDRLKALAGLRPKDIVPKFPAIKEKRTGKSMGESCEDMAKTWNIERVAQDELAAKSHQTAARAYSENFFDDLVIPFKGLKKDALLREGTTVEKLSKLRPAFDKTSGKGTLTAGNSTALTDGASAVFLCSEEYAKEKGLPILAFFEDGQSAGVNYINDEGLLMAPVYAVSKMLQRQNMKLQDFDLYEIHEAFAAQVLCTLAAWNDEAFCKEKLGRSEKLGEIDHSLLNVNGGSLALGHPFGATGGRLVGSLAKMLKDTEGQKGLISVCTAGGMGVAAILRSPK